jgi:hypothetical protein
MVEKFFSKEIKYLVSNKREARYVQCHGRDSLDPSPDSGHSSPHPRPHPGSHRDSLKGSSQGQGDMVSQLFLSVSVTGICISVGSFSMICSKTEAIHIYIYPSLPISLVFDRWS